MLIDSADPALQDEFMEQLRDVPRIDYVVSQHAEQDHSGAIPQVLERFPNARLICSGNTYLAFEQITGLIPRLRVEVLGPVLLKGYPTADTFGQLDTLAVAVAEAHQNDELISRL